MRLTLVAALLLAAAVQAPAWYLAMRPETRVRLCEAWWQGKPVEARPTEEFAAACRDFVRAYEAWIAEQVRRERRR